MTDEEIIAIRKATLFSDPSQPWSDTLAFARALIAAEREACAKVCDCYTLDDDGKNDDARRCAAAIRARTEASTAYAAQWVAP